MKPNTRLPTMLSDSDYMATGPFGTQGVYRHACS